VECPALKCYVYDRGYAGASLFFSDSKEEALRALVYPMRDEYKRRMDNHNDNFDVVERPNVWTVEYERHAFYPETLIKEYDVVEGLLIEIESA
jgi:hypothetical protein